MEVFNKGEIHLNKKVLLRERKRYTARGVVNTPSVVLTGYPPPILTWPGGYPARGYPTLPYPTLPYPTLPYPRQGTPWLDLAGYHPWLDLAGYPPLLPHGILGNVAKHYGIWVPPRYGQTNKVKLLPSRRTTYAGGNKEIIAFLDTFLIIFSSYQQFECPTYINQGLIVKAFYLQRILGIECLRWKT